MARKFKTFETSLGFCDLAIATPSMKATPSAWRADSNLFDQGVAKESDDPESYPHNIERTGENSFQLSVALAASSRPSAATVFDALDEVQRTSEDPSRERSDLLHCNANDTPLCDW